MEDLRIYLADDDSDDRDLFMEAAKELGIRDITVFPNGKSLLDRLGETGGLPDLVFLDINMPVMSGVEALIGLRAEPRLDPVFVIMFTTSSDYFSMADTLEHGANAYVIKPGSYDGLLGILKKSLSIDWKTRVTGKSNFLLQL